MGKFTWLIERVGMMMSISTDVVVLGSISRRMSLPCVHDVSHIRALTSSTKASMERAVLSSI